MRRTVLFAALALALALPTAAAAQAAEVEVGEQDALDRAARALFSAGATAFEEGRYERAVLRFQRAYELSAHPELLYDIGTAADRARMDDVALEAYRAYLREAPDGRFHERVEARVARIVRQRDARARAEAATAAASAEGSAGASAEPASEASSSPSEGPSGADETARQPLVRGADPAPPSAADDTAAHWLLAVGAAVAVAGGAALAVGALDRQAVEDPAPGTRWAEVEEASARGPVALTAGFVAAPAGLVALAAGLIWALANGPTTGEEALVLDARGIGGRF